MLDRIFFLYVNLVWFGLDFELTNLHSISFLVICFTKRNYIDSINSSYCCGMNSFFFHKNMTSKLLDWLMCRENFYNLIQLKLFAFCCYWQWLVFTEFYRVVPTGTALEKNGRDRSLLALCSLLFLFIFFLFFFWQVKYSSLLFTFSVFRVLRLTRHFLHYLIFGDVWVCRIVRQSILRPPLVLRSKLIVFFLPSLFNVIGRFCDGFSLLFFFSIGSIFTRAAQ